jgi:hypothetical protein
LGGEGIVPPNILVLEKRNRKISSVLVDNGQLKRGEVSKKQRNEHDQAADKNGII